MYIVRDSAGSIVAITSRKVDADTYLHSGKVDKQLYTVEKT